MRNFRFLNDETGAATGNALLPVIRNPFL